MISIEQVQGTFDLPWSSCFLLGLGGVVSVVTFFPVFPLNGRRGTLLASKLVSFGVQNLICNSFHYLRFPYENVKELEVFQS